MTGNESSVNVERVQNILLIWLDKNIDENASDYQNTISRLRQTINTINMFTDDKECVKFLENIRNDKASVIISGSLGQHVVPHIHDLIQVNAIFIFCGNRTYHETWAKNWCKIKGVFTEISPICDALKKIAHQCEQDAISMSFVKTSDITSLKKLDQIEPSFMYTTILKEILLTIPFNEQNIQEYINYCRNMFADNVNELQKIDQFEHQRTEKSPVWWYTCECFLYPMLNRALRLLDGNVIIKMGFFITDLHRQLEQLHGEQFHGDQSKNSFTVYRGQGMTKTDFDKLQQTKGGLLSFNNFLSTSKKRHVSMNFAQNGAANPDNVGILFTMTIQPNQSTTPFASIAHISYYGAGEDEILFAMHSVFRINDIQSMDDDPRIFRVDLTLTTDNDRDLATLTDRIRVESAPDATGWNRLALVLAKLGQFEKAQQIYEMFLALETTDTSKAHIYNQLGIMKAEQGDYQEAIRFYEKTISIEEKLSPLPLSSLANTYNNMGGVYAKLHDYTNSIVYSEKSLTIKQQLLPPNHPALASSYNNIGVAYKQLDNFAKALSYYEKALSVQQQSLPPNHPNLATSYGNIGNVYFNMCDYTKAYSSYEKALIIQQQSLPPNHPDLASTYDSIGNVYHNMGQFTQALSHFEKALAIKRQILPANHPDLAVTYNSIGLTHENINDYSKAHASYKLAIEIAQELLPPDHPDLLYYKNNLDRAKSKL